MAIELLDASRDSLVWGFTQAIKKLFSSTPNMPSCQYCAVVKSSINFNIRVHNIVENKASTSLKALLRKIYTSCTDVSALLKLFFN
jgi:hypothetical protein